MELREDIGNPSLPPSRQNASTQTRSHRPQTSKEHWELYCVRASPVALLSQRSHNFKGQACSASRRAVTSCDDPQADRERGLGGGVGSNVHQLAFYRLTGTSHTVYKDSRCTTQL